MIRVSHPQDFWSGLLFIAIGALAAYLGRDFAFGTMTRMGPGFLPKVLAWLMMGVGAIILLRSLVLKGEPIQASRFRPQILIVVAILLFAQMIDRVGMVPTVFVVTIVASLAAEEMRWRDTLLLAVGLSAVCTLLFIMVLGLPMRPFAWSF
jgi:hypothetical protein